jgi:heme-binding NEAT domain protein
MGQKTKAVKDGKTTITVTVNDSKFLTGTTADYTINFRVTEVASGKTIDYSVDPRIKLNPPPRT